jgi:hypothetical protein
MNDLITAGSIWKTVTGITLSDRDSPAGLVEMMNLTFNPLSFQWSSPESSAILLAHVTLVLFNPEYSPKAFESILDSAI